MLVTASVRRYVDLFRTIREESRTRKIINALPLDIRKDIGWPDQYVLRRTTRARKGKGG